MAGGFSIWYFNIMNYPPTWSRNLPIKTKKVLWLSGVLLVLIGLSFFYSNTPTETEKSCTLEAKICSDGTAVGRSGPNCEFAECPVADETKESEKIIITEDGTGVIKGSVNIGPLCPVEPCDNLIIKDIYLSHRIVLEPLSAKNLLDLDSPIVIDISSDGSFQGEIPAGNYSLDLSNCQYLGCKFELPKTIKIKVGEILNLNINIDTGIR